MDAILALLKDRAPILVMGLAVLVTVYLAPIIQRHRALSKFPLHGSEFGSYAKREKAFLDDARGLYSDGYRKFKNAIYRLTTSDGERVVLPPKYLAELRSRRDDEIDNMLPIDKGIENRYTGVIYYKRLHFATRLVRSDLTHNLVRINPSLSEEVKRTVRNTIPPTEDWAPITIRPKLLDIVARVSGHIFIGPELCHREEYLRVSIDYAVDVFTGVRALKEWPKWSRPIGRFFTPELKRIDWHRKQAKEFLLPVIRERRRRMRRGEEMGDDILQWMMAKAEKEGVEDEELAVMQLGLSMAAIHTTTQTVMHILFDLAAYPALIPDLRKEIEAVLAEHDGVMSTQALFQMKLLDSLMKESHRMNLGGGGRFSRYISKQITLSDGTVLPAGATIEVPYAAITRDSTLFPNPDTLDPYRFYRLRKGEADGDSTVGVPGQGLLDTERAKQQSRASAPPPSFKTKNKEQYQFVSVTEEDMAFGYGRHACPGRFFAANVIKLILARILLEYDISLPEGVTGRYENIYTGGISTPKIDGVVRFRRVRGL